PFRIRSTYPAARRHLSRMLAPYATRPPTSANSLKVYIAGRRLWAAGSTSRKGLAGACASATPRPRSTLREPPSERDGLVRATQSSPQVCHRRLAPAHGDRGPRRHGARHDATTRDYGRPDGQGAHGVDRRRRVEDDQIGAPPLGEAVIRKPQA